MCYEPSTRFNPAFLITIALSVYAWLHASCFLGWLLVTQLGKGWLFFGWGIDGRLLWWCFATTVLHRDGCRLYCQVRHRVKKRAHHYLCYYRLYAHVKTHFRVSPLSNYFNEKLVDEYMHVTSVNPWWWALCVTVAVVGDGVRVGPVDSRRGSAVQRTAIVQGAVWRGQVFVWS